MLEQETFPIKYGGCLPPSAPALPQHSAWLGLSSSVRSAEGVGGVGSEQPVLQCGFATTAVEDRRSPGWKRLPQRCYGKRAHRVCASTQVRVFSSPSSRRSESPKQLDNLPVQKQLFSLLDLFQNRKQQRTLLEHSQASCSQHSSFCKIMSERIS